jgi:hypothetical protein
MRYETRLHPHRDNAAIMPILGPKAATVPLFGFEFKRRYGGMYTNRHDRFVLREEHVSELKRVTAEYNKAREHRFPVLSMSDVVNSALDLAFEHPVALARLGNPKDFRDGLAKEFMRKAFFHFAINDLL